jgi:site-specific DNA recombinase
MAGSARRVPAAEIEALVLRTVREHLRLPEPGDDHAVVEAHVIRVEIQAGALVLQLAPMMQKSKRGRRSSDNTIRIPWHKASSVRRREILLPDGESQQTKDAKPIRSETRATLVAAICARTRLARRDHCRSRCHERKHRRARALQPAQDQQDDLAGIPSPRPGQATIEGRLPHGMGVARLFDLPAEWSRQRQGLGLATQ